MGSIYPYRAFISYAHSDRCLVERLAEALEAVGVAPLWDKDLLPGTGFSEQIQSFITNSNVFLPFLTAASVERPWLHQEIGFATALKIPVVPVTLGSPPSGIISGIQAVHLSEDMNDASDKFSVELFHRLLDRAPDHAATYECTEDNARRAVKKSVKKFDRELVRCIIHIFAESIR